MYIKYIAINFIQNICYTRTFYSIIAPFPPLKTTRKRKWPLQVLLVFLVIVIVCITAEIFTFANLPFFSGPLLNNNGNPHISLQKLSSRSSLPKSLVLYQKYLSDCYSQTWPLYSELVFTNKRLKFPINLVLIHKERDEDDKSFGQYVNLSFHGEIKKIQKQRSPTKIEEIGFSFKEKSAAHFVLIEGGPGMGKSTLCWQLCRLWREGKLQWDLMVIVELRDESTRRASNLFDLFQYHPDDNTGRVIAQDIQKREGEGLLVFLDGYDELSDEQQSELSVIQQILTNKLLRKATVVVTSRPLATTNLPSQFKQGLDQHIEIAGFNETDIQTYITLACGDNHHLFENFRFYVNNHPFILSVMYNPLHCSIVTELYIEYWQNKRKPDEKEFAPNTLTELYNAFLVNLLKRKLPANLSVVKELSDLPSNVYNNLMQLAELAAKGLAKRKYIFYSADLPNNILSLMVAARRLHDSRPDQRTSYTFLHLTLQEYLSALHWSQNPNQLPSKLLSPQIINSAYTHQLNDTNETNVRWSFILFLAGLTKLESFPALHTFLKHAIANDAVSQACLLLFEAQSKQLVSTLFAKNRITIKTGSWFVLGYCIVFSGHTTKWELLTPSNDHLQELANGMHYFGKDTAVSWDEKQGPFIKLVISESINNGVAIKLIQKLHPFSKAIIRANC